LIENRSSSTVLYINASNYHKSNESIQKYLKNLQKLILQARIPGQYTYFSQKLEKKTLDNA